MDDDSHLFAVSVTNVSTLSHTKPTHTSTNIASKSYSTGNSTKHLTLKFHIDLNLYLPS